MRQQDGTDKHGPVDGCVGDLRGNDCSKAPPSRLKGGCGQGKGRVEVLTVEDARKDATEN